MSHASTSCSGSTRLAAIDTRCCARTATPSAARRRALRRLIRRSKGSQSLGDHRHQRQRGIVARQVLVGSNERRGTRRDDFCAFLRRHVAPAMLKSAAAAGIDRDAPLYLMMDNASIHRGAVVSHALRKVSRRLHVAYQPPYMPTVNPVELVNNHLKSKFKVDVLVRENENRKSENFSNLFQRFTLTVKFPLTHLD
jgi:hypothetical protein